MLSLVVVAGFAAQAKAATFTVGTTADTAAAGCAPASGTCSLRQLILYENARSTPPNPVDTIKVPAGSYDLTSGSLVIQQSMTIAGAGARSTSIYQETTTGTNRVFDVQPPRGGSIPTVTISGLGVFFGKSDSSNGFFGGDIRNQVRLTLSHDLIADGATTDGSGGDISNDGGSLTVTHSLVEYGVSSNSGGGGGDSGGIQNFGPNPVTGTAGTLNVDNSTITANSAAIGGAIMSWCGGSGGACSASPAPRAGNTTTIMNSTIADNDGGKRTDEPNAGGLLSDGGGTISVENSIVAFNTVDTPSAGTASNCGPSAISSLGHNLETAKDCGFRSTGDLQNSDPRFIGGAQDWGGDTNTFALHATSPAVDAIPASAAGCAGSDQRDVGRPQGSGCDIGAYELFQPIAGRSFSEVLGAACPRTGTAVTIDWGDGTSPFPAGTVGANCEITGTHTYAKAGNYSGAIHYSNSDGVALSVPFDVKVRYVTPTVSSVSPSSGPLGGGTGVTITGTDLAGATAVGFGSTAASSFAVNSDTQITAISPPRSAGIVDVTVTTAGGTSATSASDRFSYSVLTVPSSVPVVQSSAPVVRGSSGAAFSGVVDPEGLATTAYFEYGLDPKYAGGGAVVYGATTAVQQIGSDLSDHPVSVSVSGLLPNALYHVRLVALNGDGTTIGPDETFKTAMSAPPPPPVLGVSADVTPVSGVVYIKLPHGKSAYDLGVNAALSKGRGFVPLTEARQLPSGTQIDARGGTLDLVAAPPTRHGKQQMVKLSGALVGFSQSKTGLTKGLTTLSLLENAFPGAPSYAICPKAHAAGSAHAAKASPSNRVVQSLHLQDNHGQFRTRGRYSSATVRGTIWRMGDRCDGTLTAVQRGSVSVFVFATRKTITLHAGQGFLARALTGKA